MHYLFRSISQYHNPEFLELHCRTGCLALYILEKLVVPNILYFLFLWPVTDTHLPDHLQTPTFQIIS